jgi:hypothetical protein
MELTENIESINRQLVDLFGVDTVTGQPMYRVVFSEDEYEMRKTDRTKDGFILLTPTFVRAPKYSQWIHAKYILESLVGVPDIHQDEILTKTSYEPLWVFEDDNGNALPPVIQACKFVVDIVRAATGKKSLAKYVDEEAKNPEEEREKRINLLSEQLFGDESNLMGRTITGEAVIVPEMPKKE